METQADVPEITHEDRSSAIPDDRSLLTMSNFREEIMNLFHFYRDNITFSDILSDILFLTNRKLARYGGEDLKFVSLEQWNHFLEISGCEPIEEDNLLELLKSPVVFSILKHKFEVEDSLSTNNSARNFSSNSHSTSSESGGSDKAVNTPEIPRVAATSTSSTSTTTAAAAADSGTSQAAPNLLIHISPNINCEAKVWFSGPNDSPPSGGSSLGESERLHPEGVISSSNGSDENYRVSVPLGGNGAPTLFNSPDYSRFAGSISSVRLQNDIQRLYPEEYEYYVENLYGNKFTLFVEVELSLESFIYNEEALQQDIGLAVHISPKELRLKQREPVSDAAGDSGPLTSQSIFNVTRWDSAIGLFLKFYCEKRFHEIIVTSLHEFLTNIKQLSTDQYYFLNEIDDVILQSYMPNIFEEEGTEHLQPMQLTNFIVSAFAITASSANARGITQEKRHPVATDEKNSKRVRPRNSSSESSDDAKKSFQNNGGGSGPAVRNPPTGKYLRLCHLGTAVTVMLSDHRYLLFLSRTRLRSIAMTVLFRILFPEDNDENGSEEHHRRHTLDGQAKDRLHDNEEDNEDELTSEDNTPPDSLSSKEEELVVTEDAAQRLWTVVRRCSDIC